MSGKRLLISALPGELRAVLLDADERMEEVVVRRAERPQLCGSLFRGRVQTVDRALQAAFVDVGLQVPGFLPFKHCPAGTPHEGTHLAVCAVSEPPLGKGPKLTARIAPADAELAEKHAGKPDMIRRGADGLDRLLQDPGELEEIVVDRADTLRDLSSSLPSRSSARLRHDPDPHPLFERWGLEDRIEGLLLPAVTLEGRAVMRIEPVTALVAIDVDSASATTGALNVDLAAAREIPRQLRLRGLGGLVVVDFLSLPTKAERQRVSDCLAGGFREEEQVEVRPMSPGGLVEISRRRLGPSLLELLCEPAGLGGTGWRKTALTLAYEALRAVRLAMIDAPGRAATLRADAGIVHALEGPAAAARREVENALGRAIALVPLASTEAEDYEIVLG